MIANNQILSKNWSHYNFAHSTKEIYNHENLDWRTINYYYIKAHRSFYLMLSYIIKRIWKSIINRTFFLEIKSFFQLDWF